MNFTFLPPDFGRDFFWGKRILLLYMQHEIQFLEGSRSRWADFKFVVKVAVEFIRGFRALHFSGPCVTVFGSARFKEDSEYYQLTQKFSAEVAKLGFTILTGGGPGLWKQRTAVRKK